MKRIDRKLALVITVLAASFAGAREAAACSNPDPPPPPKDMGPPPPPPCVILCPLPDKCIFIYQGTVSQPTVPPNQCKCAQGRTIPNAYQVTRAALIDDNGNLVQGFQGFLFNQVTTNAFQALAGAPPDQSWFGFASYLNPEIGGEIGSDGNLAFTVRTQNPPINWMTLNNNGLFGIAQSDLAGGNFDPEHQAVLAIPQGCFPCAGGIIPGNPALNPPLCAAGLNAHNLGILSVEDVVAPAPVASTGTAGCSVDQRGRTWGGGVALLLVGLGLLVARRQLRRRS